MVKSECGVGVSRAYAFSKLLAQQNRPTQQLASGWASSVLRSALPIRYAACAWWQRLTAHKHASSSARATLRALCPAVSLLAPNTCLAVHGCEDIGPDYAVTLRAWRQAWEEKKEEVLALGYSERFWRKYRFYCECGCAALLWYGLCHGSLSSVCRFARLPVSAPLARTLHSPEPMLSNCVVSYPSSPCSRLLRGRLRRKVSCAGRLLLHSRILLGSWPSELHPPHAPLDSSAPLPHPRPHVAQLTPCAAFLLLFQPCRYIHTYQVTWVKDQEPTLTAADLQRSSECSSGC